MNFDTILSSVIDFLPAIACLFLIRNCFRFITKLVRGDDISENGSSRFSETEQERTYFIGCNYSPDSIGFFENSKGECRQ